MLNRSTVPRAGAPEDDDDDRQGLMCRARCGKRNGDADARVDGNARQYDVCVVCISLEVGTESGGVGAGMATLLALAAAAADAPCCHTACE